MQSLLLKLQTEVAAFRRPSFEVSSATQRALFLTALLLVLSQFGTQVVLSVAAWHAAEDDLPAVQAELERYKAELALHQEQTERLERILQYSTRFGIPADLAALIEEIALAEEIDPEIAFNLVRVESRFNQRAVSPRGAIGYTQIMPATAKEIAPKVKRHELFEREVNLRLGFRFFRTMLDKYNGNTHLALLAYNRGPGTVNRLLAQGRDPNNGYVRAVLGY